MRKVLVVTSGRADRTPLMPVKAALAERAEVQEIDLGTFNPGSCVSQALYSIVAERPDIMLVLGDRYETMAACFAATYERVPIAHIHGGEASFGSFDNQFRDAVTKLSHIHFVASLACRNRLRDIGEHRHVHVVGAPGLDNLRNMPPRVRGDYILATYHPVTLEENRLPVFLRALDSQDRPVIWTVPNRDPGHNDILTALAGRDVQTPDFDEFVRLCRGAACIVGNSSMGIIEAPYMGVPTVNVGTRQDGRIKGPSVFSCREEHAAKMIEQAVGYDGPFVSMYGQPGASRRIAAILANIDLDGILVKRWSS